MNGTSAIEALGLPPSARAALASMLEVTHADWRPVILRGLQAIEAGQPGYLATLLGGEFLPTEGRLFAAFTQPLAQVRYVLVGEGPYPRAASATGVCFMDGAVGALWSDKGLSKPVNRATSLRNFMKMLLVANGRLAPHHTAGDALAAVAAAAQAPDSRSIQTLPELQANLLTSGFLLLNAALVLRAEVAPVREARAWQPFLETVLDALAQHAVRLRQPAPTLVLWGKVAAQVEALPVAATFPRAVAEHPYNLSFINNTSMHALFGPLALLQRPAGLARASQGST